jgi:excisionase family DNA binding protein
MPKVKRDKRGRMGTRAKPISAESVTLTPLETRKITRFGTNRTYKLLNEGIMPAIKVGSRFYIHKAALLEWLKEVGSRPAEMT